MAPTFEFPSLPLREEEEAEAAGATKIVPRSFPAVVLLGAEDLCYPRV